MNKIKLNSWGKFTNIEAVQHDFKDIPNLKKLLSQNKSFVPSGNFRSYGDSAFSDNIISCRSYNKIIKFDKLTGVITAQAGTTLCEILSNVVPHGWFLGVSPGTKYTTLGGAIASDVHGKNHHLNGCFSQYLSEFELMLHDGSVVTIRREDELFKATCGGMGLTGIIISATMKLVKIKSSYIDQITIKTKNLKETFSVFEKYANETYSVAWFDGFAKGADFGKSIIQIGNFSTDGRLEFKEKLIRNFPFKMLSFFLTKTLMRIFNYLYYSLTPSKVTKSKIHFDKFFYPLDLFSNWNKIYGKNGLLQYQFILPLENSYEGTKEIFSLIQQNKIYPYLAVLKLYGDENENYLSFPIKGYSLALDFPNNQETLNMLENLDSLVLQNGGRVYLTKDARIKEKNFKNMYPKVEKFIQIRKKYSFDKKIQSSQSVRIGI